MGRFLGHDVVFDTDAGLQGYNLFIYCGNNPINRIDISGADSDGIGDGEDMLDEALLEGGGSSHRRTSNSGGGGNINAPSHKVDSYNYAGNGGKTEIHHVVEQCQAGKSGFSNQQIQASTNKVALDYNLHRQISGFYSSKPPEYGGLRVRDWLAGQSFETQTAFGWHIVNKYYLQLLG